MAWRGEQRRRAIMEEIAAYDPANIHGNASFGNDAALEAKKYFEPEGIPVGDSQESGRTIYFKARTPLLTIGKNGSGKSTNSIQRALLSPSMGKYSVILLDTTGEHSAVCMDYRSQFGPVDIINPCDVFPEELKPYKRSRWNPIGPHWLCPASPMLSSRAGAVAAPIFPRIEGNNRYFYDSPRNALKAICMAQAKFGKPGECNLPFIAREIINGQGGIFAYARYMVPRIDDPFIRSQLLRFSDENAEKVKSIVEFMETAVTEMDCFNDEAVADCLGGPSDVTFGMCKEQVRTISIVLPLEVLSGGLAKLLKLTLSCIIGELMRKDGTGDVPVVVIADELYALLQGQADNGIDVAWSASRKYNWQLWACVHDLSQLKELFPKTYQTFINNAGVQQWLAASDLESSTYLSSLLGEKEVYGLSKSLNYSAGFDYSDAPSDDALRKLQISHNQSQHGRKLMLPFELRQQLGPREQILVLEGVPPIRAGRRAYYEVEELRRRARPNPFHRESTTDGRRKSRPPDGIDELLKQYAR
jgi:type IV secretion system protein VirD4